MRIIRLIAFLFFLFSSAEGFAANAKKEVKQGNLLYNKEQFSQALKHYQKALKELPDSDIVNFNLGTALYKNQQYQEAADSFEKALVSLDKDLVEKSHYNIGNSKYKLGIENEDKDTASALNLLEEALYHYQKALAMDAEDEDAKHNYDFVKEELERLKEKLKQQQQENQQNQGQQNEPGEQESGEQKEESKSEENKEQSQNNENNEQQEKNSQEKESQNGQEKQNQSQGEKQDRGLQKTSAAEKKESSEEMSEKEALMLLDSYRQDEEPQELYKDTLPQEREPKVLKDW
ncbi:MAG: tetratricopeptide repeat protein [Candidatus Omnitrophica bacterium]|nr:tetratricopeptide repeat protein [Candidatus Omnitrophota bacterium]